MRVTLTFDNGPTPGITEPILDLLGERGISAIFFAVGDQVAAPGGRTLAERVKAAGHRVGNHSMTHRVPLGDLAPAEAVAEITDAAAVLDGLLDPVPLFRPFGRGGRIGPHLLSSDAVDRLCADQYTVALWSSVPRDWVNSAGWVDVALEQIGGNPWPVVVLHDFTNACLERLPDFLDKLGQLGAEYRTDLPDDCTPIRHGQVVGDITPIVTDSTDADPDTASTTPGGRP